MKIKSNRFSEKDVENFWDNVSDIYDVANDKIIEIHNQRFKKAMNF